MIFIDIQVIYINKYFLLYRFYITTNIVEFVRTWNCPQFILWPWEKKNGGEKQFEWQFKLGNH